MLLNVLCTSNFIKHAEHRKCCWKSYAPLMLSNPLWFCQSSKLSVLKVLRICNIIEHAEKRKCCWMSNGQEMVLKIQKMENIAESVENMQYKWTCWKEKILLKILCTCNVIKHAEKRKCCSLSYSPVILSNMQNTEYVAENIKHLQCYQTRCDFAKVENYPCCWKYWEYAI